MRIGILTVSSSKICAPETDESGKKLLQLFSESLVLENVQITNKAICDVIITTGGTGLSFDDVTPEPTKRIIKKECPGIVQALLNRCLQATPMGALTRLAAGIYRSTLIINLPGSPKACAECFQVLEPILNHAVHLLTNKTEEIAAEHFQIQEHSESEINRELAAGIYRSTLIINLPGSPRACAECFQVLEPILNHAVHLLTNKTEEIAAEHFQIQEHSESEINREFVM
uniref:Molybdopterin molybdotransferase n=1 Tax=Panagrolaimus sp. JU765 TaxID=591449 RepID=A0AC34QPQ1_9BILA